MSDLSEREQLDNHSIPASQFPNIYSGTILSMHGELVSVQEAAEFVRCGIISERRGRWAITDFGVEFLAQYYCIDSSRVHEEDWLRHLKEKQWFSTTDEADFKHIIDVAKNRWPESD